MKLVEDNAKKLAKMQTSHDINFSETEKGALKTNSVMNVMLILLNDKSLKGLFKFNEFTDSVDISRKQKIQLSTIPPLNFSEGKYEDKDTNSLEAYIEASPNYKHTVFKNALIEQAVDNVARANSYNPLVDYFNNCLKNWDRKRRVDNFFPTYLGAEKDETDILITRLWLMGAVAKAYNPLVKFDYVLDLVGGQGAGKTTLLQKLAPLGLYTDQFTTFTDKDDFEVMRNALIVNDDEMTASNRASFEEIKKFITMQRFEYRKSYGRNVSHFNKKFVISRTTNEIKHLKDKSGDRRFISILVNPDKQLKHPVTDLTQDYVDQLWGEVVWLYQQAKDPFILDKHQSDLLKKNREQFMYTTSLEDELDDVLENTFADTDFIANTDLAYYLLGSQDGFTNNRKASREVRYYMQHKGWDAGTRRRVNGKITRGFRKM
ncbi:VapE family protein [Lactobacillus sp. ESL0731]|uniref:VapE domain-containing protein n=1 Tax=unclassified Lactobacillus TaxID=2620435 RepID=UPI0023F9A062|nr:MULTISPECIES: VapE domain-containing protein [unclassified Lactobacillus]WEV51653.1 VapE family protein [Lactobacillus sp. ESL0700]WEV62782.1 VapE family protein [Lactobacillus sp. ESL0731]